MFLLFLKIEHCKVGKMFYTVGTRVISQWLRTLAAFPGNPGLIPKTHMVTNNHLEGQFQRNQCSLLGSRGTRAHMWCMDIYEAESPMHTKQKKIFLRTSYIIKVSKTIGI